MKLSIITSTFNRKDLMLKKLESLRAQTLSPSEFEWLVFVNGSDDTFEVLTQENTAFSLTLLNADTPLGIGEARNKCINAAQGGVLYFSDDDCLLETDTLEKHLNAQKEPCVAIGAIEFIDDTLEHWKPTNVSFWNLNGANSSVPRDSVTAVGQFDDRIRGYGGEDLLLGYKLHKAGLTFKALPDASTKHMGPNPMRGKNLDKARSAGSNAAKIAQLYPELAYRLGVSTVLMNLKRLSFGSPLAHFLKLLNAESFAYEKAYFEGALTTLNEKNPQIEVV